MSQNSVYCHQKQREGAAPKPLPLNDGTIIYLRQFRTVLPSYCRAKSKRLHPNWSVYGILPVL